MNRREVLKSLGVIALSASFPAVLSEFAVFSASASKLKPHFFSPNEFVLLENVVDTMVPRTTTPGGLDVQVPVFIDLVVKDCLNTEDQQRIRRGLNGLTKADGRAFSKLSNSEKTDLIKSIDEKAFQGDAESVWLKILKKLVLVGYFTSREGMTEALNYVKIPGTYEGCISYKKGDKASAKTFLIYY